MLPNDDPDEDTARLAIGQEQLAVTPVQMAMVAGAIANGGTAMAPRLMTRIVDRGGSLVQRGEPEELGQVMSPSNAAELAAMMEDVVREGTGTRAALSGVGVTVAGKTGTAESDDPNRNQAWFIGFAPAEDPQVAVAVVIEDTGLTGGEAAAPRGGRRHGQRPAGGAMTPLGLDALCGGRPSSGGRMTFEPGELIGGRYELGRQLGAGGMARVYLGHDRLLDRQVAVKVLAEPYASDPQFVERFRREASAAAGLNHPNIVAVYDRGEADGSYYIVMEYLSGPDLKQVIRRRAPLPPLQAIDFAQQILAALGAAHRRDVVHRDVKPQNVLVAEDGHLKVTDFGIAARRRPGGHDRGGLRHRHGAVPLARAGARRRGDGGQRLLRGRHRPLRDAHRAGALRRRPGRRGRDEADQRRAHAAPDGGAERAARARVGRHAGAGQAALRALPHGRRVQPRPVRGPHGARRLGEHDQRDARRRPATAETR